MLPKLCFTYSFDMMDTHWLLIMPVSFELYARLGRISHSASTMHAVIFELTFVESSTVILLPTHTVLESLVKLTFISPVVLVRFHTPIACFFTHNEVTFVSCAMSDFFAFAVLESVFEIALVLKSAIIMFFFAFENSIAMELVTFEVSFINCLICVYQTSTAMFIVI